MIKLDDYINDFGEFTFTEKPFNEIDNLIFSQLAYIDFENIITSSAYSVELSYASKKYFELHSEKEIDNLIKISQKAVELMSVCAKTKRFGNTKLCHYVNNVNEQIDKQFSAVNFLLNDGSLLVAFRGTDITVTGVKESAMLSYMFPVPAQIEALHYFQETAMNHNGDVRVCGHSKGGNLAVFAAVSCSNSLKKKIAGVYENDAPGFPKWFFDRYDYQQIKDKIVSITPNSSIIGRMLYHDAKPVIVKSNNNGLKQHQVSSWIINDDYSLDTVDEYDFQSDLVCEYINNLIDYIGDDDLELFFDTLEYLFENSGVDDFYDLKEFDIKKVVSLIDTIKIIDESQKERFKHIIKKTVNDFTREYLSEKGKTLFGNKKSLFN
ncbi:MAG: Mbeg1-like protein [Eubacterium sp.]